MELNHSPAMPWRRLLTAGALLAPFARALRSRDRSIAMHRCGLAIRVIAAKLGVGKGTVARLLAA